MLNVGEKDLLVLTFDHIDPSQKKYDISKMIGRYSIKTLKKEIEKCRTLCCNCHARHSATQQQSWRLTFMMNQKMIEDEDKEVISE